MQQGAVLFPEGERINNSPEYTAGLSADYVFPLSSNDKQGRFSIAANYNSEQSIQKLAGGLPVVNKSDDIINARMSLGIESGDKWSARLFIDNLLNEDGSVDAPLGAVPDVRLRPRTAGIQLTYNH